MISSDHFDKAFVSTKFLKQLTYVSVTHRWKLQVSNTSTSAPQTIQANWFPKNLEKVNLLSIDFLHNYNTGKVHLLNAKDEIHRPESVEIPRVFFRYP